MAMTNKWLPVTILYLFVPLICFGNSGQLKAWWYESEIEMDCDHPHTGNVIYKDNCLLLLSNEILESIDGFSRSDIEKYDLQYALQTDIDMDGNDEYLAVAVYANGTHRGRALIIGDNRDLSAIRQVLKVEGLRGFSALTIVDGKVRWYFCMECNEYYTVAGTVNGYFLE